MRKILLLVFFLSLTLWANAKEHAYTELEENYLNAVYEHDLAGVKEALKNGVDINLLDESKRPPLIAVFSSIPLIGNTAKADEEREQVLNYLINQGIDVNAIKENGFGETALTLTIHHSMYSVIENLLKYKVSIQNTKEIGSIAGDPPLFSLVRADDPLKMLHFLIEHKAGKLSDVSTQGDTLLHAAVNSHLNMKLMEYLSGKISLEAKNKEGNTVLLEAITNDKNYSEYDNVTVDEVVQFLINKGADVKAVNKKGHSVLTLALTFSHSVETIKSLIDKGADVNKNGPNNVSPVLFSVATYDTSKTLALLLKHGADINTVTMTSLTALHIAVINRKKENVAYLLEKNIAVNSQNKTGKTALNVAEENSYSDIVSLLKAKGAKLTSEEALEKIAASNAQEEKAAAEKKNQEITSIYKAIEFHKFALVKSFYEKDSTLKTKLIKLAMYSVRKNDMESLQYFLDQGLKINTLDDEKYNFLQQAVYYDQPKMIEFFIGKGLKLTTYDKETRSYFSLAANTSVKTFKSLVKKGMKAEEGDAEEIVGEALAENKNELATYLLSQKYTLSKNNLADQSFVLGIVNRGDIEAVKILLANGLDIEKKFKRRFNEMSILIYALQFEQYDLAKFLMNNKADVLVSVRGTGNILPSLILSSGKMELLELLLEKGYGVNYKEPDNVFAKTLLDLAYEIKNPKSIVYLINKGANVEDKILNRSGTPLFYATKYGYFEIIKLLVEKGANPYAVMHNYTDEKYFTLDDISEENRHKTIIAYYKKFDILAKLKKKKNKSDNEYTYVLLDALKQKQMKNIVSLSKHEKFKNFVLQYFYRKAEKKEGFEALAFTVKILDKYKFDYDKYKVLELSPTVEQFIELLNQWNTDNFLKTKDSYSLMLNLVAKNKIEYIKVLLKKNISVEPRDDYYTFTEFAKKHANSKTIQFLKEAKIK